MNSKDAEDLLARRLAGEDVARGEPQISAVAEQRRMSWSALVRQWIAECLARDAEAEVDPVVELHHHLDAATRALRALEGQRDAA